ncbi:MAG TPA: hypothetical protein VHX19_24200 [Stellaceae bacterium]|jgi:hypothetical protein|nr:hypothetical protein [Stellaceae bacterium]
MKRFIVAVIIALGLSASLAVPFVDQAYAGGGGSNRQNSGG